MEDPGAAQFDNATVDSALREAITDQDVDAVRRLLATPGYRFPATPTAVEAVQTILDLPQCTARVLNTGTGEHEKHDVIPDRNDDDRVTALHVACAIGRPSVVRAILRDGRADLTLVSVDEVASTTIVFALDSLRLSVSSTTKFVPRLLELDPPPLPSPRRRALPQMPRVLLVPGPVETVSQRDGLPPRLRSC